MLHIVLKEKATIYNLSAEYLDIKRALKSTSDCCVTGDKVTLIDTAFLQFLVSLKTCVEQQGATFSWKSPSTLLLKQAKRLGLSNALGLTSDNQEVTS